MMHDETLGKGPRLIYTSQELGGALGIAIASSIAAGRCATLLHGGTTVRAALAGGFRSALWGRLLCSRSRYFLLIRKDEIATAVAATLGREPHAEPAAGRSP